jgi:3-oxoadipate enol-lactonase
MPQIPVNGVRLYIEDTGGSGPPILFSHGLLYSCRMWDAQVPSLRGSFRCISYDHRGQGQSEVTEDGYDMDTLALDAAALIRSLGIQPVHFVGLSMGGFIGMRLAARHPELVRSLVLLDTSADPEPPDDLPRYRMLTFIERWLGPRLVAGAVLKIMHGPSMRADPSRAVELRSIRERFIAANRVGAVRAVNGVLSRKGMKEELQNIRRARRFCACPRPDTSPPSTTRASSPSSSRVSSARSPRPSDN